jgi:two-component system, sensor histidine kinase
MQPGELEAISRQVNQPVDALTLLARALRSRTTEGESELILEEIELGLRQMRRRLASLLDVMRAEISLSSLDRVEFPLMPLFDKLALQTAQLAQDNRVNSSIVPTSARVISNPAALEVILRNLLVNGLFFAQGGRVLLGCRTRGDAVQIQVWDNGVGIPPKHQAIIFEPLQKLRGDGDGPVQGLGLGLSLVRDLTRALGHGLDLRSEPSLGSVFSLTLPRASA